MQPIQIDPVTQRMLLDMQQRIKDLNNNISTTILTYIRAKGVDTEGLNVNVSEDFSLITEQVQPEEVTPAQQIQQAVQDVKNVLPQNK